MIDTGKIEQAVSLMLEAIGEDPKRDGLIETPARVARSFEKLYGGYEQTANEHLATTFEVDDSQLVVVKDIEYYTMCEHHMLPFYGKVTIAYIPGNKVVGLSKLARVVEVYARRLQIQEKFTQQICKAIYDQLGCEGVFVKVEGEHMCMSMRGVEKAANTITTYKCGTIEDKEMLLTLIN